MIPRLFSLHLNSIMFTPYSISFRIVVDCHRYGSVKNAKRVYFERDANAAGWLNRTISMLAKRSACRRPRRLVAVSPAALKMRSLEVDDAGMWNLERKIGQVRHVLALEVPPVQRRRVTLVGEAPVPGYLALGKTFRGRGGDGRGVRGQGPSETRDAFRRRRGSTASCSRRHSGRRDDRGIRRSASRATTPSARAWR